MDRLALPNENEIQRQRSHVITQTMLSPPHRSRNQQQNDLVNRSRSANNLANTGRSGAIHRSRSSNGNNNAYWSRQTMSSGFMSRRSQNRSQTPVSQRHLRSRAASQRLGQIDSHAFQHKMAIERQLRGEASPEPVDRVQYEYCGANYDKYMENLAQKQEAAAKQQELKRAIIQKQFNDVIVGQYFNLQLRTEPKTSLPSPPKVIDQTSVRNLRKAQFQQSLGYYESRSTSSKSHSRNYTGRDGSVSDRKQDRCEPVEKLMQQRRYRNKSSDRSGGSFTKAGNTPTSPPAQETMPLAHKK